VKKLTVNPYPDKKKGKFQPDEDFVKQAVSNYLKSGGKVTTYKTSYDSDYNPANAKSEFSESI